MSVKPDLLEFGPTVEKRIDPDSSANESKEDGVVTQKIDNLERELQELREQMSRIMAAQFRSGLFQTHKNILLFPSFTF